MKIEISLISLYSLGTTLPQNICVVTSYNSLVTGRGAGGGWGRRQHGRSAQRRRPARARRRAASQAPQARFGRSASAAQTPA